MTEYRRNLIPGGTFFFTVALADRASNLLVTHIDALRAAIRYAHRRHPFESIAWVILPDHLHALWTLPLGDTDYSTRWRLIKTTFSRFLPQYEYRSKSRIKKGERGIWQRRYWEHTIRDETDLERHFDYIHFNPVKHGHVARVGEWPYSTFHKWVKVGFYKEGWGVRNHDHPRGMSRRKMINVGWVERSETHQSRRKLRWVSFPSIHPTYCPQWPSTTCNLLSRAYKSQYL